MKRLISILLVLVTCMTLVTSVMAANAQRNVTYAELEIGQTEYTTQGGYTLKLDSPVYRTDKDFDSIVYVNEQLERVNYLTETNVHYLVKEYSSFKVTDANGNDASDVVYTIHYGLSLDNLYKYLTFNAGKLEIRSGYSYVIIKDGPNDYTFFRLVGINYNENDPKPIHTPATKPVFTDVPANAFYKDTVDWAVVNGITKGTSANTFSPEKTCTRGEILTFLWRASGSPQVGSGLPFSDLTESDYVTPAARWAKEMFLVQGDKFEKDTPCTRQYVVWYLWCLSRHPQPGKQANFQDMTGLGGYDDAISWAVEQGITKGTSATTFSPYKTCTRGEIVTFLYRYFNS